MTYTHTHNLRYEPPTLTKRGNISQLTHATIASGEITGDGLKDVLNFDGTNYEVVGGAGGVTPVDFIAGAAAFGEDGLDADGDGKVGIYLDGGNTKMNRETAETATSETAANDGWDDPARD